MTQSKSDDGSILRPLVQILTIPEWLKKIMSCSIGRSIYTVFFLTTLISTCVRVVGKWQSEVVANPKAFYLYAIIKDWPNQETTKKLFRTAVPNFIFDYTRVPFCSHSICFVTFKRSEMWVLGRKMSFLPFQSIPHAAVLVLLSLAADVAGPPTWMRSQCSVARQARPCSCWGSRSCTGAADAAAPAHLLRPEGGVRSVLGWWRGSQHEKKTRLKQTERRKVL
jgi:hypothetical protein